MSRGRFSCSAERKRRSKEDVLIAQLDDLYIRTRPTKALVRLVSYALFEGRPLTTSGSLINTVVFRLMSVFKKMPTLRATVKPIFIIGTGRSGTTILGKILSMHKEVGFLNEPKAAWHSICSYEDVIGSYSREDAQFRLGESDATQEVIKRARRIYGAYLLLTAARRVVDKYPEMIFRMPFIKKIFPDAKFIFLVRSGMDTCRSIVAWNSRHRQLRRGEIHDWWGVNKRKWHMLVDQVVRNDDVLCQEIEGIQAITEPVDMAAVEWYVTMKEGLSQMRAYPDSVCRVYYEELVSKPREVLESLADFCGLPCDEVYVTYGQAKLTNHPRGKKEENPLPLNAFIGRYVNDMMRQLGYPGGW